jgi:hypothetical protein
MPEMTFLGDVTSANIPAIVESLRQQEPMATHPALRERVVRPEQFEDPNKTREG